MKRLIIALLFILLPTVCHADDINDVMLALKHMNGIALNGTSCADYAAYLEAAKSEVDYYLKSEESKKNKKLKEAISETLHLYEFANTFFCGTGRSNGLINFGVDASPSDKKITSEYFALFPQDKKDVSEGGVLINRQGIKFHKKTATIKIFKQASIKYAELVKLLN
jgi:hypothetical protein